MFTLHAFASTTSANAALTNLPPLSDPAIALSGNFLFVPALNNLIGVYGMGATLLRGQLTSPSLLANVPYDVTPVDASATPSVSPALMLTPADPIKLVTDEPLQALHTNTNPEQNTVAVFLSDGPLAKVSGSIIRARGTVTTAGTANTWGNGQITLTNQLAEGTYQLVGARVEGAHGILFRFVFPGGSNSTRPGGVFSHTASAFDTNAVFRNGNLGVWGTFSNRVLPTLDTLTDGTTETATVILDLIKTA